MKTKEIYILLTHSGSMFSKAINIYTRVPYTHVSIGLDRDLQELYSFGRRKPYNPIIGGFVREDIVYGTYGRFPETRCALYSLEINELQYKKLLRQLDMFKANKDRYSYNLIGLVGVIIHRPIDREYSYFCSQFVGKVLLNSGIDIVGKSPGLTSPMDFLQCKDLQFIYEGNLRDYKLLESYAK